MQLITDAQKLFFSTTRISVVIAKGVEGAGTGFYFLHDLGKFKFPVIVTNKHVVANARRGTLTLLKGQGGKPTMGRAVQLDFSGESWAEMWIFHSDPDIDVAICPLQPIRDALEAISVDDILVCVVGDRNIPDQKQLDTLDAIEQITFVGYPNGIWDEKNLIPIARRGYSASPITVDYDGLPRFIIDASIFPGSSGNPVFILDKGPYSNKEGALVFGGRFFFLGIVAAGYYRRHFKQINAESFPGNSRNSISVKEMIDLGIVHKARTVLETIEQALAEPKFGFSGWKDIRHITT